jgi:hypothetical protein
MKWFLKLYIVHERIVIYGCISNYILHFPKIIDYNSHLDAYFRSSIPLMIHDDLEETNKCYNHILGNDLSC